MDSIRRELLKSLMCFTIGSFVNPNIPFIGDSSSILGDKPDDLERVVKTAEIPASDWRERKSIDKLYDVIAEDLIKGKPIIIANYLGLWVDGKPPERNLYWGALYGHKSMFDRAGNDPHSQKNFKNYRWEKILEQPSEDGKPIIAVYKMEVAPNQEWRKRGVLTPIPIYQVYLVYSPIYQAGIEMFRNLWRDEGRTVQVGDLALNLGSDARIVGYIGHNLLMDGVINEEVSKMRKTTINPKGAFFIGCDTASYFQDLTREDIFNLLFTTSFMAPEGYNSLAFVDGLSQALPGEDLARHCNKVYRYYQELGGKKPGPLFVNHSIGMF